MISGELSDMFNGKVIATAFDYSSSCNHQKATAKSEVSDMFSKAGIPGANELAEVFTNPQRFLC